MTLVRRDLPSGTVTFLFTDIEGSTLLTRELGDRYPELLAEHRRVLRAAFAAYAGVEVDTQGDSFFIAFARASDAVSAAAQAQKELNTGPLRVRMGLHTGEPQRTDEGYAGLDVVRASRIAAVGHGGQVLLSQTARDFLSAADVRDLGEHRLKDLPEPVRIFQLGGEDFPPLRSLNQTNLSLELTALVGRRAELDEAARLLRGGVRLLTLVGPPGAGKTRLGLQLASDLVDEFREGVFLVGLAPLADASLVAGTIAETVGAQNGLVDHLRHRRALLVLDNFEHVTAAAPVIAELLRGAPRVALVVTSREPLRLTGEHEFPVAPLPRDDAVSLFVARARSAGRQVEPDETVAEICSRLDRLPLAIELAAARTKVLSPRSLLTRLDRRLPLLVGGPRDAPERQRTLHATIDWSYQLLDQPERALLARLSVFTGGCDLEAAEQVCDATLEAVGSFVDKSLLQHDDDRFTMLDTIREYALERLDETGDSESLRRRHADYFLALATRFKNEVEVGRHEAAWTQRLTDEQDNLRAALDWSHEGGHDDLLARLTDALYPYWSLRSLIAEAGFWLDRAIEVAPRGLLHRKLVAGRAAVARKQGDLARADELFEQALTLNRSAGDTFGTAICLHALSSAVIARGDLVTAASLLKQAGELFDGLGKPARAAVVHHDEGLLALQQGDTERARRLLERELAVLRGGQGPRLRIANALADLGFVALVDGRDDDASAALREALTISREIGSSWHIADCVMWIAALAQRRGELDRGARLAAAAKRLRGQLGNSVDPYSREVDERTVDTGRARAEAWDEGSGMPLEQAITEALAPD